MKSRLPLKKGPYQSRTLLHILLETTVLFVISKNVFGKFGFVSFILFTLIWCGVTSSFIVLPHVACFRLPFIVVVIFCHINTSYFSLTHLCFVGLMSIDFLSCFCYDKIKVGPLKWVTNFILPHQALRTWKPILIITLYIALYHTDIPRSYIQ